LRAAVSKDGQARARVLPFAVARRRKRYRPTCGFNDLEPRGAPLRLNQVICDPSRAAGATASIERTTR